MMGIPSLLLRPEGSYSWSPEDGVQVVTPTVGADVDIVGGQWRMSSGSVATRSVSSPMPSVGNQFTILARVQWEVHLSTSAIVSVNGNSGVRLERQTSDRLRLYVGGQLHWGVASFNNDQMYTVVLVYDNGDARLYVDGVLDSVVSVPEPHLGNEPFTIGPNASGGIQFAKSSLIFPEAISDAEIHRISTMPESWTMANVSKPEMRLKLDGEVVRASGMYIKRSGLLKPARLPADRAAAVVEMAR